MTFNDHEGSTKSYLYTRKHEVKEIEADFVPLRREIIAEYLSDGDARASPCTTAPCVRFRSVPEGYDPHRPRRASRSTSASATARGEIATGLLYVNECAADVHELNHTPARALQSIPLAELCPGAAELAALQADFR